MQRRSFVAPLIIAAVLLVSVASASATVTPSKFFVGHAYPVSVTMNTAPGNYFLACFRLQFVGNGLDPNEEIDIVGSNNSYLVQMRNNTRRTQWDREGCALSADYPGLGPAFNDGIETFVVSTARGSANVRSLVVSLS